MFGIEVYEGAYVVLQWLKKAAAVAVTLAVVVGAGGGLFRLLLLSFLLALISVRGFC